MVRVTEEGADGTAKMRGVRWTHWETVRNYHLLNFHVEHLQANHAHFSSNYLIPRLPIALRGARWTHSFYLSLGHHWHLCERILSQVMAKGHAANPHRSFARCEGAWDVTVTGRCYWKLWPGPGMLAILQCLGKLLLQKTCWSLSACGTLLEKLWAGLGPGPHLQFHLNIFLI